MRCCDTNPTRYPIHLLACVRQAHTALLDLQLLRSMESLRSQRQSVAGFRSLRSLEGTYMLPSPAPEKASWNPVLITIGIGILFAIVSFVVVTSQWGRPTTSVATVGFFGILFGILIFAIGCIWFIVKIVVVVSRSR